MGVVPWSERGLTLTELTIVVVLAAIVTVGLVTFYYNSQATWVDASTQALTQREATGLVQSMTNLTHDAASAEIFDSPDSLRQGVSLLDDFGTEQWRFWWEPTDSLVHRGQGTPMVDLGPVVSSRVERFQLDRDSSLVYLRLLELRSAAGRTVQHSTSMSLRNRP